MLAGSNLTQSLAWIRHSIRLANGKWLSWRIAKRTRNSSSFHAPWIRHFYYSADSISPPYSRKKSQHSKLLQQKPASPLKVTQLPEQSRKTARTAAEQWIPSRQDSNSGKDRMRRNSSYYHFTDKLLPIHNESHGVSWKLRWTWQLSQFIEGELPSVALQGQKWFSFEVFGIGEFSTLQADWTMADTQANHLRFHTDARFDDKLRANRKQSQWTNFGKDNWRIEAQCASQLCLAWRTNISFPTETTLRDNKFDRICLPVQN